jgi:cytosine permease
MASSLPDYVASARPVPMDQRVPWFKSTAQTYAGIMLWFVFWQDVPSGVTLANGLIVAFAGLVLAALLCHFLYYLVPGMLGMKTGLPLYIVGTSTYGVQGGFLMPGFLMGILQFGWLGVNSFFSSLLLVAPFFESLEAATLSPAHRLVAIIWAIVAALVGLKGIKYVASIASFLPAIPLVILAVLFLKTVGGIGSFDPDVAANIARGAGVPATSITAWGAIAALLVYIIGFFATAGAAGADFGMNNRDAKDVQLGGLIGIAGATIFAGGLSLLIVAGAIGGSPEVTNLQTTALMPSIMGTRTAAIFMYLLAIAAFPPACFSSFIAANSFRTTLPKVNPFLSVGVGTAVSILLAVTGWAGDVVAVFIGIWAAFGPICGAMMADYLLSGSKWAGPRAGFNLAGWISWVAGFLVGAADFVPAVKGMVPVPPLAAFVVGFILYMVLAKAGLESRSLAMEPAEPAAT